MSTIVSLALSRNEVLGYGIVFLFSTVAALPCVMVALVAWHLLPARVRGRSAILRWSVPGVIVVGFPVVFTGWCLRCPPVVDKSARAELLIVNDTPSPVVFRRLDVDLGRQRRLAPGERYLARDQSNKHDPVLGAFSYLGTSNFDRPPVEIGVFGEDGQTRGSVAIKVGWLITIGGIRLCVSDLTDGARYAPPDEALKRWADSSRCLGQ